MDGIQSESALPGDPTLSQTNNNSDKLSFKRLFSEFGVSPSTDFRVTEEDCHGLGSLFIYVTNTGPMATAIPYPGDNKFRDEGGKAIKGNLIYFIRNDNIKVQKQLDFFMTDKSEGLTQAGLGRLIQSVEAFVYLILGSQKWLAFSSLHKPLFSEHKSVYFANSQSPPADHNRAYCKTLTNALRTLTTAQTTQIVRIPWGRTPVPVELGILVMEEHAMTNVPQTPTAVTPALFAVIVKGPIAAHVKLGIRGMEKLALTRGSRSDEDRECQNYQSLSGRDRHVSYGNTNTYCDSGLSGWFRFEGSAGSRMATSCQSKNRCNTHAPGYLTGGHPSVADGQFNETGLRVCPKELYEIKYDPLSVSHTVFSGENMVGPR
ncbi:Uromodulin [Stylophora pistillata]|uniref:Uromodulin n=1 Tax=Stylophora pistillata TaxID=50429 RepID=A0A2B4RA89_STYPI|nr:Uromodulin [Stylophora pistillata]